MFIINISGGEAYAVSGNEGVVNVLISSHSATNKFASPLNTTAIHWQSMQSSKTVFIMLVFYLFFVLASDLMGFVAVSVNFSKKVGKSNFPPNEKYIQKNAAA